jgi:hypothetical protein
VTATIVPPIFVWDPDDLAVFRSVAEAQSALEPIDVVEGRWAEAWDATGRPLSIRVEGRVSRGRFWIDQTGALVVITAGERGSEHVEKFRAALVTYLRAIGRDVREPGEWSQEELISEATTWPPMQGPDRYWFIAVMDEPPATVTDGLVFDEGLPGGPGEVPNEILQYALWSRSAAGSLREARAQLARWFREEGVPQVELVPIPLRSRRLTRSERKIGAGMAPGDLSVRAVFVAFKRESAPARAEACGFIEEIVLKEWWQFWR